MGHKISYPTKKKAYLKYLRNLKVTNKTMQKEKMYERQEEN
jgi:hypothetical protein